MRRWLCGLRVAAKMEALLEDSARGQHPGGVGFRWSLLWHELTATRSPTEEDLLDFHKDLTAVVVKGIIDSLQRPSDSGAAVDTIMDEIYK